MRVLLIAPFCNPTHTSEPLVAYNLFRALSRESPHLRLATYSFNENALRAAGVQPDQVIYVDGIEKERERFWQTLRRLPRIAPLWRALVHIHFERSIWRLYGKKIRQGHFDIIHRITPVSPTVPSPLAVWSDIPMVVGPVNGGLPFPKAFRRILHRERDFLRYVRGAWVLIPYARSTFRRAAAILAAFDHTIERLPRAARARAINAPEVGADCRRFSGSRLCSGALPLKFLFVGRLVPFKCADVAIRAFAASDILRISSSYRGNRPGGSQIEGIGRRTFGRRHSYLHGEFGKP